MTPKQKRRRAREARAAKRRDQAAAHRGAVLCHHCGAVRTRRRGFWDPFRRHLECKPCNHRAYLALLAEARSRAENPTEVPDGEEA